MRRCDTMADDSHWASLFFDEANIVHTFQLLLMRGNQTLDDLFQLCLVVNGSTMLLAFTIEGLTPFAMHSEYVIPYAKMNKRQLHALRRACSVGDNDVMAVEYGIEAYVVKIDSCEYELDNALMLFAAACIILKALSTQTLTRSGYISYTSTRLDPSVTRYHLNNAMFKIVHSCSLRQGVQKEAMCLVNKHKVLE